MTRELSAWLTTPRTNPEIRERVRTYDGAPQDPNMPLLCARTLRAATSSSRPPATGATRRRNARFVLDPRPLPDPEDAGGARPHPLPRGLRAGVQARRRRLGGRRPARLPVAPRRDRLLPGRAGPRAARPARPAAPARGHAAPAALPRHWDQPLLAYADRDRIIPPEVAAAEAHAQRRLRRSPSTAASSPAGRWTAPTLDDHAARRLPARRGRGGGPAHRPLLRARARPPRGRRELTRNCPKPRRPNGR